MGRFLSIVLVILFVAIISVFPNPDSSLVKVNEALIDNLCRKTSQPGICESCLHGDPSSLTANAAGLSRISVTCAVRSATLFVDDTYNAWNESTDSKLKPVLYKCWNDTVIAREIINTTFWFLDKNDFYYGRANMFGAIQAVIACVDELFHKELPGTPVPDLIMAETDIVRQDCEVVVGLLNSVIG